MSKDYELGRLAEELIASRFKKDIEDYEKQIMELRGTISEKDKEIQEEKDKKTYLRVSYHNGDFYNPSSETHTYSTFDELTQNVKNTREDNDELKSKLEDRERDIRLFKESNFWERMVYKFNEYDK